MADKRIQDLTPASSVGTADRFVLEQSGQAKSLTGQVLIRDLATALDGHGGIADITYTAPTSPSLNGTLTITTADGTTYTATVTNGRGISGITWTTSGTAGDGQVHTGTIAYNDGTTSTVTIEDGVKGDTGDAWYVHIKYASTEPTADADMTDTPSAWMGLYSGVASTAPTHYTDYEWYQIKGAVGDTGNGIESVTFYQSLGDDRDQYRIVFTDGTYTYFTVQNGSSIQSISKTSTIGLVDTYTVLLTNGNTTTFTVTNAKSIASLTMISGSHAAGTTDTYRITYNDGDTFDFGVYNGTNGTGSVSTVSGIQADGNGDVPQVVTGNGAPTASTVGQEKQLYFDYNSSTLYICLGESGGAYSWQGAAVTVDSSLSTTSTNPVQNAVITGKVGTAALNTTAQTLSGAVNELDGDVSNLSTLVGSGSLDTTATTLVGAVNELKTFEALRVSWTVSSSNLSYSNSAIKSDMRVLECSFGTPRNVKSDVGWTTANGSITLSGTFDGSTTVDIILAKTN